MNIIQAAKFYGVHPCTIMRMWHRGDIKGEKVGHSHKLDLKIEINDSFTVKEFAKRMNCSPRWIQILIKRKIINYKRHGNRFMINANELTQLKKYRSIN